MGTFKPAKLVPFYAGADRHLLYTLDYSDRSPGFLTETGFLPGRRVRRLLFSGRRIQPPSLRPDVRSVRQHADYRFRPEGKYLISWGPNLLANGIWDHQNNRLHRFYDLGVGWELSGETHLELFQIGDRELLRPGDIPAQVRRQEFSHHRSGMFVSTNYLSWVSLEAEYSEGTEINLLHLCPERECVPSGTASGSILLGQHFQQSHPSLPLGLAA